MCGAGFLSWQALIRHCESKHGDYAEYRKHLFWRADSLGFLPLLPWHKRHMLANFSFFQCFSVPESGGIQWTEQQSIQTAVPRQEIACAVCARKDWIEHRYRVYLWQEPVSSTMEQETSTEPQNASGAEETGAVPRQDHLVNEDEDAPKVFTKRDGCFCFGNAHKINKLLNTQLYADLMPKIPQEELFASSIQHPRHPEMTWLLHTRRTPILTNAAAEAIGFKTQQQSGAAKPAQGDVPMSKTLDTRCAGVGDMDATVWCCKDCISDLCREDKYIKMPPPALANLLWLGREHPLCQKATTGTRMLSCLGRPVWRKLILGRGHHEETEKGIRGNFIFLAQARVTNLAPSLPPRSDELSEA